MLYLYVSSWEEHGGAPGLSVYTFDEEEGTIRFVKELDRENSLNWSVIDPQKRRMYVCNEIIQAGHDAPVTGRIFVYSLDPESGDAVKLKEITTGCPNPAYISITADGRFLIAAHHSTNLIVCRHREKADGIFETITEPVEADLQLWNLDDNGVPDILLHNIDHAADLPNGAEAHPHSAAISPDGRLLAVADKGLGTLEMYRIDEEEGKLVLLDRVLTDVQGAHPRYIVFHPTMPYLFVNHEGTLDGVNLTVSAFRFDADGKLTKIGSVNALEPGHTNDPKRRLEQQGLDITPDGKYLITVINSADVLAVLKIDEKSGRLTEIGNYPVTGIWPRGLKVAPDGKFCISTCLVTGEVNAWRIGDDGTLTMVPGGVIQRGASNLSFYDPAFH